MMNRSVNNFCLIFIHPIRIKKITIFAALKNADVA